MTLYHFVAASEAFLTVEEPLEEVLRERVRHYGEQQKAIDFWLLRRPRFLEAPELAAQSESVPRPAAAVRRSPIPWLAKGWRSEQRELLQTDSFRRQLQKSPKNRLRSPGPSLGAWALPWPPSCW